MTTTPVLSPASDDARSLEVEHSRDWPTDEPLTIVIHGQTDVGRARKINEDQFVIVQLSKELKVAQSSVNESGKPLTQECGHLFAVADGMGGHAGGEHASAMAIGAVNELAPKLLRWCYQLRPVTDNMLLSDFQRMLREADKSIFETTERKPELQGMGTTLTIAFAIKSRLFIAHAGDSRAYIVRNNALIQITHDHTVIQEMIKRGLITEEEAQHHRYRHVITNAIGGTEQGVKVEMHQIHLEPGDIILLCSDGLTEMVPDVEIQQILVQESSPEAACSRLLERANEQGGRDNITAIVARVGAPTQSESESS